MNVIYRLFSNRRKFRKFRRINKEHRLVYSIKDDSLIIISCKGHYGE